MNRGQIAVRQLAPPLLLGKLVESRLLLDSWLPYLEWYPDQKFARFLRWGIAVGFKIWFNQSYPLWLLRRNYWREPRMCWEVHIWGGELGHPSPAQIPRLRVFHWSPIRFIPKDHEPDNWSTSHAQRKPVWMKESTWGCVHWRTRHIRSTMGFPVASEKVVSPLSLVLNWTLMRVIWLPHGKLTHLKAVIGSWVNRKAVGNRSCSQSLVSSLLWYIKAGHFSGFWLTQRKYSRNKTITLV